jgi:hypothetical protein
VARQADCYLNSIGKRGGGKKQKGDRPLFSSFR